MNDTSISTMLAASIERILREDLSPAAIEAAEDGAWPERLWSELEGSGLLSAMVAERFGGAGLAPTDLFETVFALGRFACPVPAAEAMFARWLTAQADLPPVEGLEALGGDTSDLRMETDRSARVTGWCRRVPWGRRVHAVVVSAPIGDTPHVLRLPVAEARLVEGRNFAGEPCDDLLFDDVPLAVVEYAAVRDAEQSLLCGAALRSAQMAGALRAATEFSVRYAKERSQFGRPIAAFQAVQQLAAELETQTVAAHTAAALAFKALGSAHAAASVAVAKARTGEAATLGSALAHQIHGAMGYTREYPLNYLTRRMWSWRDDFGSEHDWAARVGGIVVAAGADRMWDLIVAA